MKFTASRLSDGNKLFPDEIQTEPEGIKVRIRGFLKGDTTYIDYENITGVDVNTPLIGYSSITFFFKGNKAYAHGFIKDDMRQIKQAIDAGKQRAKDARNPPKAKERPPVIAAPQKTKHLYSDELETLIEYALADGALTEKEKTVLFRKAAAEGIDEDEFAMVIAARLHQMNK